MDEKLKTHEAWHDRVHAQYFDTWFNLTYRGLKNTYESFNEVRLLLEYKSLLHNKKFLEVGCATGELYRYINHFHGDIDYNGIDISEPAIERAKKKYPKGKFFLSEEKKAVSETVRALNIKPAVLFARDVILHQTNPFEFLEDLLSIPSELTILRIRTRDKGATILDPEISCQWHYEKWVPYMILNLDEVFEVIRKNVFCESIHIVKNYMQLGGHVGRFLPKECYYPETGTAESAICIKLSKHRTLSPKIIVSEQKDANARLSIFDRKANYLFYRLKAKLLRDNG